MFSWPKVAYGISFWLRVHDGESMITEEEWYHAVGSKSWEIVFHQPTQSREWAGNRIASSKALPPKVSTAPTEGANNYEPSDPICESLGNHFYSNFNIPLWSTQTLWIKHLYLC